MATLDNYSIVKEMLDNDGVYPGDPQVLAIYEYTNTLSGAVVWSVIIVPIDEVNLFSSPYVQNPQLLWSQKEGHVRTITNPEEVEETPC